MRIGSIGDVQGIEIVQKTSNGTVIEMDKTRPETAGAEGFAVI